MENVGRPSTDWEVREQLRQARLFASGILSMRGNDEFRAITDAVATLMAVPMAAISVLDRDRQWFPSAVGLDMTETARAIAVYGDVAALPAAGYHVADLGGDPVTAANAMVSGSPFMRSVFAVPIETADGTRLGALCAIDVVPRTSPSVEQRAAMAALAKRVVDEVELPENFFAYAEVAIERIVDQIRTAARRDQEPLLLDLDRILRQVEQRIESAAR